MSTVFSRFPAALGTTLSAWAIASVVLAADRSPGTLEAPKWVAADPDAMLDRSAVQLERATRSEPVRVASAAMAFTLAPRATFGKARKTLIEMATAVRADDAALAGEIDLLALVARGPTTTDRDRSRARELGVVANLMVLGPIRDTGGGFAGKLGPEAKPAGFTDPALRYAWGAYDARWRAITTGHVDATGLPLDLWIAPRRESCSYVATTFEGGGKEPYVVRVAGTGQLAVFVDGKVIARSPAAHEHALFDRLGVQIDAPSEPHTVVVKDCAGALGDDGRVRIRTTARDGSPIELKSRATLGSTAATSAGSNRAIGKTAAERVAGSTPAQATDRVARAIAVGLAGLDDQQSPKLPGEVHQIVTRTNAPPDAVAALAWVTTSGSNRSAWLRQARDRAKAQNDRDVAGFASRRLIADRIANKMPGWAYADTREELQGATDAEAKILRATALAALGAPGQQTAAARDLRAVIDSLGPAAPTTAHLALARIAEHVRPDWATSSRWALVARGEGLSAAAAMASVRAPKAIVELSTRVEREGAESSDEATAVAQALIRSGMFARARHLLATLVAVAPNDVDAWSLYADALAVSPSAQDQAASARAARRALDLAPGDTQLQKRAELRQRAKKKSRRASDEKYIVQSEEILKRRKGVPASGAPTDVADRELYWLRAVVMHEDRRVSQLIQYAREIVIAPRTQDELYEAVPQEGDLTEIVRARVHRRNGGIALPVEEHDDGGEPVIRWPELYAGDTVEVVVRSWTERPVGGRGDAPYYFLDYGGSRSTHPLLYNEVVVDSLEDAPIHVKLIQPKGEKVTRVKKGKRSIVRVIWQHPMEIPEEPLAPHMSEVVPVLLGSTFRDWSEFKRWYKGAIAGFTEPDEQVRRLAAELTRGKTTSEAKIRALFDYVADDIRYVNYVSGEWWLPNRPQELLARREGDCDDKAVLLIALLRAIGIEAEEVMVQTRLTAQPSVVRATGVAVPMFDHGIAFVKSLKGGTYLDATSPQSRLGPLPAMDARAVALRLDDTSNRIVTMPPSAPAEHGSSTDWTLTLKGDGSGRLTAKETYSGDAAFWLRTRLAESDDRASFIENGMLRGWFSPIRIKDKVSFDSNVGGGQARLAYAAHSGAIARLDGHELVVPLSGSATWTSQLAPLVSRKLPVVLPPHIAPSHDTRRLRIVAPPGHAITEAPDEGQIDAAPFGRASLRVVRRGPTTIDVIRHVEIDRHHIAVAEYAAFRGFLQRVDALFRRKVRIGRLDAKAKATGGAR